MKIALLGWAGSGKTTVFDAIAAQPAATPPGAWQTETHVQVVPVVDPRLEHCREMFQPRKYTPAGVELWDPPGLPPGPLEAARERRHRLLAQLREADAYVLVVRGFTTPSYAYDRPAADPAADLAALAAELVAADYTIAEGRAQRLRENIQRKAKSLDQDRLELAVVERVLERLEGGRHLRDLELDEADDRRIRGFQLFTRKPHILLLQSSDPLPEGLGRDVPLSLAARFALDGQIERELRAMDAADRPAFMAEFGIEEAAAARFVREVYGGVGLLSFFTVGEDEVRAWTVRAGATAVEAAGAIHTDLAKGFVRAEVFAYEELAAAGSMRELKARGGVRLEPKDYVVKDGDIVHIRSAL